MGNDAVASVSEIRLGFVLAAFECTEDEKHETNRQIERVLGALEDGIMRSPRPAVISVLVEAIPDLLQVKHQICSNGSFQVRNNGIGPLCLSIKNRLWTAA